MTACGGHAGGPPGPSALANGIRSAPRTTKHFRGDRWVASCEQTVGCELRGVKGYGRAQGQGQQTAQSPSTSIFTRVGSPANDKAFEQRPLYSTGGWQCPPAPSAQPTGHAAAYARLVHAHVAPGTTSIGVEAVGKTACAFVANSSSASLWILELLASGPASQEAAGFPSDKPRVTTSKGNCMSKCAA